MYLMIKEKEKKKNIENKREMGYKTFFILDTNPPMRPKKQSYFSLVSSY